MVELERLRRKGQLRLFISQPVDGRTDEEVFGDRFRALENVQAAHPDLYVVLIESFLSETVEGVNPPLWYLGASIQLMSKADVVYMAPGWLLDRRCMIERSCASTFGIEVVYYSDFVDREGE